MTSELKELRITYNTSQQELAEIAGVSTRSIIRYENGTQIPSLEAALRISNYYNMMVEDIFHLEK